jgi:hypothetical protein
MSFFPGSFDALRHGHTVESLRGQGGAPWSRATGPFAGTSPLRGELDSGPDANAEVLCGAVTDNKNPRFPGISSLSKALWRTRTADPLLTMEVLYQLS